MYFKNNHTKYGQQKQNYSDKQLQTLAASKMQCFLTRSSNTNFKYTFGCRNKTHKYRDSLLNRHDKKINVYFLILFLIVHSNYKSRKYEKLSNNCSLE